MVFSFKMCLKLKEPPTLRYGAKLTVSMNILNVLVHLKYLHKTNHLLGPRPTSWRSRGISASISLAIKNGNTFFSP